eukprot:1313838-Amphidinium_carterae.1
MCYVACHFLLLKRAGQERLRDAGAVLAIDLEGPLASKVASFLMHMNLTDLEGTNPSALNENTGIDWTIH